MTYRCTAYNRRVNKRGALFLLESIAALIGTTSSSSAAAAAAAMQSISATNFDPSATTLTCHGDVGLQCQSCQSPPVVGDGEIVAAEETVGGATAAVDRSWGSSRASKVTAVAPDDVLDFSDDDNDNDNDAAEVVTIQQPTATVPLYANPKPNGRVSVNAHSTSDDFDELPAAITSFDDDWWSPPPPPPPPSKMVAAESTAAAPPPQPVPLAHDHAKKLLATISPTKKQRHLSLNKATIRDSGTCIMLSPALAVVVSSGSSALSLLCVSSRVPVAVTVVRSRGLAIQSKWTDAVPDFVTDSHHQHP